MQTLAEQRGNRLMLQTQAPGTLRTDATRLRQMLFNRGQVYHFSDKW